MKTLKHTAGERLLVSNKWGYETRLKEVLVMEVAESGHYIKFCDLVSGAQYWRGSDHYVFVEKLPPLFEGEPVKPYKSPTVADCDRFFNTTCGSHSNPDDSTVLRATNG